MSRCCEEEKNEKNEKSALRVRSFVCVSLLMMKTLLFLPLSQGRESERERERSDLLRRALITVVEVD